MSVRRLDPVQPAEFSFSPQNATWAKKTIAQYPPGKQASAVIALLWRAQEQCGGWLPRAAMEHVAQMLEMSDIRVLEVATFYTMFQLSPVGRKAHIQVCGTTPCMLRGAEDLKKVCQRRIHHDPHHLSADQPIKPGPQVDRQFSAPQGGPTALTDKSLYNGDRKFTRMEAPQSPPAAPAAVPVVAAVAPAAAPAAKPAAAEIVKPAEAPKQVEVMPVSTLQLSQTESKPVAATPKGEKVVTAAPKGSVKAAAAGASAVKTPLSTAKPRVAAKPVRKESGPELLKKPKRGKGDDLKLIWGVGPALEKMLNKMGIWHFDQIAAWSAADLKWVDERLEGFKGRAKRDEWIKQSKKLATGWRPADAVGEKPKGRG